MYQETNTISGVRSYENGFPSVYVRYRMNDRITLIGSVTYTIKRPDFSEVVPRRSVDLENRLLTEGNPDLDPTLFTNYDFSIDYKLGRSGLLTLEAFYKEIEDLVFSIETKLSSGTYAGFDRRRLENSGEGTTEGILLTWDQDLEIIPYIPNGFGLNLQYRYENSSADYPGRAGELLPFSETPEESVLLTLRYQAGDWYTHMRLEHASEQLRRVDSSSFGDIYRYEKTVIDLNATYQVSEHFSVDLEFNNILNEPADETYEGNRTQYAQYLTQGWGTRLSLRWQM
jgi:TonB-dependent receptor